MRLPLILIFFVVLLTGCDDEYAWHEMEVTATAYNSLSSQTDGDPDIAAWGDQLIPGDKSIAISRDLLALGLDQGTPVKIEGLEGTYIVKDKMHSRWTKRIDIYMGEDVQAAKTWGKKTVTITYGLPKPDTDPE